MTIKDMSKQFYKDFELQRVGVVEQILCLDCLCSVIKDAIVCKTIELEDQYSVGDDYKDLQREVMYWNTNRVLEKIVEQANNSEQIFTEYLVDNPNALPKFKVVTEYKTTQSLVSLLQDWVKKTYKASIIGEEIKNE